MNITKENIHFYEHKKAEICPKHTARQLQVYIFYTHLSKHSRKRLSLPKTSVMNNCKHLFLCLTAALLTACADNGKEIEGTWMQPSGLPGIEQGFTLEEGGKAASVNMATLQYEAWRLQGSSLILTGKSIGNGQTIAFTDTLTVAALTQDSLTLKKGTLTLSFARKTDGGKEEAAPATEIFPASGTLIIGPEVRSFQPDGDPNTYWIVDRTGTLYQKYDRVTGGTKNGIPVHARLQVEDLGKSADGFARDYPSVYAVHRIDTLYKGE